MGDIAKDIKSSFLSYKLKALINIKYTANWIYSRENEIFKPFSLSPQQYNILRILRGAGKPIKVQLIKDRMIERAPNATRMMDKLCEKGLITRSRCDEDRRVVYVAIEKNGLALLKNIEYSQTQPENIMQKLTEEEARQLSDLLDKLR